MRTSPQLQEKFSGQILIPAGKFMMGSPATGNDEYPQHEVEITRLFYIGMFDVTQAEYERVTGNNPSFFSAKGGGKGKVPPDTSHHPVETVSWGEAANFCRKLSELPGGEASRASLSSAYRGRVGICVPRRDNDGLSRR